MDRSDRSRSQQNVSNQDGQRHSQQYQPQYQAGHSVPQFQTPSAPNRSFYTNLQQPGSSTNIIRAGSHPQIPFYNVEYGGIPSQIQQEYNNQQARAQSYSQPGGFGSQQQIQTQRSPQAAAYGQLRHFQTPPAQAIETLPGQFTETQAAQYYTGAQAGPSAATQADYVSAQVPTYHQTTYVSPLPGQNPSYTNTMADTMQPAVHQEYGQQSSPQLQQSTQLQDFQQGYAQYQTNIRTVFTLVRNRALREAMKPLLDASHYLLGSVESLGLTQDDAKEHDHRIMLWDDHNRAWLTIMQCQLDMVQELYAGRHLHDSQSTLDQAELNQLATELVTMCDGIEKFGLVDYQMGVAEDEIIEVILRCLSQLENEYTVVDMEQ